MTLRRSFLSRISAALPGRRLMTWVKGLLTLVLIFLLIRLRIIDPVVLADGLQRPAMVLGALGIISTSILLSALRWQRLMSCLGIGISLGTVCSVNYVSLFAGTFLPGALAGDAIRMFYIAGNMPGQRSKIALSVIVDRAIGLYSLALVTLGLMFLKRDAVTGNLFLTSLAFVILMIVLATPVAVIFFNRIAGYLIRYALPRLEGMPRLYGWMSALAEARQTYTGSLAQLGTAVGIGTVTHICALLGIVHVAYALDPVSLEWTFYGIAGAVSVVSNMLPVTPGGIGVGESVFDHVCRQLSSVPGVSYGAALFLWRAIAILATLPGAFLYLRLGKDRVRLK